MITGGVDMDEIALGLQIKQEEDYLQLIFGEL